MQFNSLLQIIWDQYASDRNVWQYDPDPAIDRPLLLLYVATDGPAIHRDSMNAILNEATAFDINSDYCLKVRTGGIDRPINKVFSIKYVAAGAATGWAYDEPYRKDQEKLPENRTGILPIQDRVSVVKTFPTGEPPPNHQTTRRFYKQLWSFREFPDNPEPVGTLKAPATPDGPQNEVEAIHVNALRAAGEDFFSRDLEVAKKLKPQFLILTSWNEFGSSSDEPSPDLSWTIMPNNKYGRRYSEILRTRILEYKAAP